MFISKTEGSLILHRKGFVDESFWNISPNSIRLGLDKRNIPLYFNFHSKLQQAIIAACKSSVHYANKLLPWEKYICGLMVDLN